MLKNVILCIFLTSLPLVFGLDCFVCDNQDGNDGKCLKTIMTCKQEEEMCMTEIRWGTMPYWQAGAKKQYFISKRCATKPQCMRQMRKSMPYCTHVWYEDWVCSECCAGDKCNYYIISDASKSKAVSLTMTILVSLIYFML